MAKTPEATDDGSATIKTRPVVAIYQNSDHVAGLVQQLYEAPLVASETRETGREESAERSVGAGADLTADASGKVPAVAKVAGAIGLRGNLDRSKAVVTDSRTSQSFVYSQAYYLNIVRSELNARGLVKRLEAKNDVSAVEVGDFVEFTAEFSAAVLPALMDVLSPAVVGSIVSWVASKKGRDSIDFTDYDNLRANAAELDMQVKSHADVARAITAALQTDFRREKTREYYGTIAGIPDVTAVTICDAAHFVVDDEDRILDGHFTVLGKVTARPVLGMPVLDRNKLLSNLAPEAVDALMDQLQKTLTNTGQQKIGNVSIDSVLDVNLSSRVPGEALRVLPIAVFV